jgi:hypothetical protein
MKELNHPEEVAFPDAVVARSAENCLWLPTTWHLKPYEASA